MEFEARLIGIDPAGLERAEVETMTIGGRWPSRADGAGSRPLMKS